MNPSITDQGMKMHMGLAEKGKMFSLASNHPEALRHYREALKLASLQKAPEVFLLHYTQCAMESLEHMGEHELVKQYCDEMCTNLEAKDSPSEFALRHYANVLERKGIQHLFLGEKEAAIQSFQKSREQLKDLKQPIAEELLRWLQRGYYIRPQQIRQLQERHHYFTVRKDKVKAEMSIDLPDADQLISTPHSQTLQP